MGDDTVANVLGAKDQQALQDLMIQRNNTQIKKLQDDIHGEEGLVKQIEQLKADQDKYIGPIKKILVIIASSFTLAVGGVLTLYFTGKLNSIIEAAQQ